MLISILFFRELDEKTESIHVHVKYMDPASSWLAYLSIRTGESRKTTSLAQSDHNGLPVKKKEILKPAGFYLLVFVRTKQLRYDWLITEL